MLKTPGIYVHLPFCDVHCSYCDFPITTRTSLSQRYYAALLREITGSPAPVEADTLYFGGGTPSLAPAEILHNVQQKFRITPDAEVTLEANPDHISAQNLFAWKQLGINRLSLGVQSLEAPVLKSMLRRHTPESALRSLNEARNARFDNVNVDLILGYPQQTSEGFRSGLRTILAFRPEHLSIYMLELHENTALAKQLKLGTTRLPGESEQIESFTEAVQILQEAGYDHYEVSNFALPGFTSRHNLKYWTNMPYFGYGAGACSHRPPERLQNLSSVTAYIDALEQGKSPLASCIEEDEETRRRNALIFGLRKTCGVQLREFEAEFQESPVRMFGESLDRFREQGLLEITETSLRLTFRGMLLSNEVLDCLV